MEIRRRVVCELLFHSGPRVMGDVGFQDSPNIPDHAERQPCSAATHQSAHLAPYIFGVEVALECYFGLGKAMVAAVLNSA